MQESSGAAEEIERSLRLERDDVERSIARYRFWFFLVVLASAPVFVLVGRLGGRPAMDVRVPIAFYLLVTTYAALAWQAARRLGARQWLVVTTLLVDLAAISAPGVLFPRFDPVMARDAVMMGSHLAPAGVLTVLFVNVLRMNARAAVIGSFAGIALLLGVLVPLEGFVPPIAGVCFTLLFTAAIGIAAARRARHTVETFARLQLLRRYLPPQAVERVLRDDPDAALALGGRLTTVTLLSSDLRGFTRLSEKLPPEEVVRQLNAYHARMLDQIERHGGALDKFMGDGILAVFGLDVTRGERPDAGAADAVACARGMREALGELNRERESRGLPALAMGIGIHTGAVVAGNIGAPGKRLEFTVIGDAVNTASRLEGLTKESGRSLLVSRATVERLASREGMEALEPMPIRGRDEPLHVFAA